MVGFAKLFYIIKEDIFDTFTINIKLYNVAEGTSEFRGWNDNCESSLQTLEESHPSLGYRL